MRTQFLTLAAAIAAIGFLHAVPVRAAAATSAESLNDAMIAAYINNPTLNAERARARATDEGVPQALAGFRPTIATGALSESRNLDTGAVTRPNTLSLSLNQTVFSGLRNVNGLKSAETGVLSEQEALRGVEQTTLLNTATAFMNLVQAQATLNLRNNNLTFLTQQVQAGQDRLNVGTGTKTDVASANASLAAAQTQYYQAVSALNTAIAAYQQIVGHAPTTLGTAQTVDNLLPKTLADLLAIGLAQHPTIKSAQYAVDTADFAEKSAEGSLLPTLSVNAAVNHNIVNGQDSASVMVTLSGVTLWNGGASSSRVRAAKETLSQRRIELDAARESVRQSVTSAWGNLDAARASTRAADAQVAAQQLVLQGFMEQLKVGQATTLDVLNAQQTLLNAQVGQVTAQHDRVVAGYALMGAIGTLSIDNLGLNVQKYDPNVHYDDVRDKLGGMYTPDAR